MRILNFLKRYGLDKRSNYCGTTWNFIEPGVENGQDLRFKQLSVGNETVWSISNDNILYFRENITKSFPEGTTWLKVNNEMKYVTVNSKNEVYAITCGDCEEPSIVVFREGITAQNKLGLKWTKIISVNLFKFKFYVGMLSKRQIVNSRDYSLDT